MSATTEDGRGALAFALNAFTPYRIVALGHAWSQRLSKAYADENLTIPEWRVLAVVGEAPRIAARDVVARTPMDKMTVSRAVANLETKGFVSRSADENDRRLATLALSRDGRAVFERVVEKALAIERDLLGVFSPAERAAFDALLAKLEENAAGNSGL